MAAEPVLLSSEDLQALLNQVEWAWSVLAGWAAGKSSDAWVKTQAPRLAHVLGLELAVLQLRGVSIPLRKSSPPLPEVPSFRRQADLREVPHGR